MLNAVDQYCRSLECDGVVEPYAIQQYPQITAESEQDIDEDGLDNDHPEEYDIDQDNRTNELESGDRGDIDGDGAWNMFDPDMDCDGIPNELDETPHGAFEIPAECGDGEVNDDPTSGVAIEECDDGNTNNLDGCSRECVVEYCGDGIVNNNGTEQCDG